MSEAMEKVYGKAMELGGQVFDPNNILNPRKIAQM